MLLSIESELLQLRAVGMSIVTGATELKRESGYCRPQNRKLQQFEIIRRFESFRSGSGENSVNRLAELAKINSSLPPHGHLPERLLPRLRCMWATFGGGPSMEKVVLLCLIIAIIGVLAELSPAPRPQK